MVVMKRPRNVDTPKETDPGDDSKEIVNVTNVFFLCDHFEQILIVFSLLFLAGGRVVGFTNLKNKFCPNLTWVWPKINLKGVTII